MAHKKILILLVVAVVVIAFFAGVLPLSILEEGLDTNSRNIGGVKGNKNKELLDSKAYILSHKGDGHSEKIIVSGTISRDQWSMGDVHEYRYYVWLKKNVWSEYELVSSAGATSKYLSNPNPGVVSCKGEFTGEGHGETFNCDMYQFTIIGHDYADGAIKVLLQGYMKENQVNPFEPMKWRNLASDEAYLYSGYGGLYLPRGIVDGEDRPYDTFEIGQEVDIRVETAKGGYAEDSKPWRVTLNEPYGGDIVNPDDGGGVVEEMSYGNDVTNGHFKFTVTEEMAQKSMASSHPYTIRIWNVLLPIGSLYVDFLDFIALAPGDVEFSVSEIQGKVGETYSIGLSSSSDIGIDYFRVSVIYGTNDVLLPSDPLSKLWLINTINVGGADKKTCSLPQTIEFIPEHPSYVTVHAKAFDLEGRGSMRTRTWTMWAYEDSPVPDEVVDDETGEEDYGGGQTPGYMPWDPEGGNWDLNGDDEVPWAIIIALIVFIISCVIAFCAPFPKKYGPYGIIGCIAAGAVLAILICLGFIPLG